MKHDRDLDLGHNVPKNYTCSHMKYCQRTKFESSSIKVVRVIAAQRNYGRTDGPIDRQEDIQTD